MNETAGVRHIDDLYDGGYRGPGEVLSVVIPALNEEDGIADIVGRIQAARAGLLTVGIVRTEIIVVDDGSQDRTCEVVGSLPGVVLVRHSKNRGYGAAIKTGFAHASGSLLAFLDADGTYPPESLPELCRALTCGNADIVVGSRRSGGQSQMPPLRRLGNLIWSNLVSLLGETRCVDPASGLRILRRQALPLLYPLPDGLNFTPVMSTRAMHEHLTVVELPIPYSERVGRSKLSIVRDGLRFLKTILWTVLEYNPAKILGLIGASLFSLGLVLGLCLIAARASGITTLAVWGVFSAYATLVLAIAGLSVYSLGVTFNFIISRFQRQPMRMGLFRSLPVEQVIEPHFGWLGAMSLAVGVLLGATGLFAGSHAWDINRVWLWLLGSALFVLAGVQLLILWVVARVVDKLSIRESLVEQDLKESAPERLPARAFGAAAGAR